MKTAASRTTTNSPKLIVLPLLFIGNTLVRPAQARHRPSLRFLLVRGHRRPYTREYTVKQLELEPSRYDDLRKFSERIAYDEATSAVLSK
jgi:hypothetical protein